MVFTHVHKDLQRYIRVVRAGMQHVKNLRCSAGCRLLHSHTGHSALVPRPPWQLLKLGTRSLFCHAFLLFCQDLATDRIETDNFREKFAFRHCGSRVCVCLSLEWETDPGQPLLGDLVGQNSLQLVVVSLGRLQQMRTEFLLCDVVLGRDESFRGCHIDVGPKQSSLVVFFEHRLISGFAITVEIVEQFLQANSVAEICCVKLRLWRWAESVGGFLAVGSFQSGNFGPRTMIAHFVDFNEGVQTELSLLLIDEPRPEVQ